MPVHIPLEYGIARFLFSCSLDPQLMYCTTGFLGGSAAYHASDFTTEAYNSFTFGFATSSVLSQYTFKGVDITFNGVAGMSNANHLVDFTGTVSSSAPLPTNCAMLVKKNTGLSARTNRGRMFTPPFMVNQSQIDQNGYVNSGSYAAIVPRVNNWFTDFTSGPNIIASVILHSDPSLTPTLVNSWDVQNQIATQRQRMRK